jgi:hypothetical protein
MSGFTFIAKYPGNHEAMPAKGTWRTEDGQPADLLTGPFPITATCATCSQPIRLENRLQYGWQHAPAGGTS